MWCAVYLLHVVAWCAVMLHVVIVQDVEILKSIKWWINMHVEHLGN